MKLLKDGDIPQCARLATKSVSQDEFDEWKEFLRRNGISDNILEEEGYDMELACWVKDEKL